MMEIAEQDVRLEERHVIIGAGEAGTRAALALRDAGARYVTLIGAEKHQPYERPPLSKPDGDTITPRPIASDFTGIDTRFGCRVSRVDRTDRTLHLNDGQRLGYDRLLLATGAQARAFPGSADAGVHTLRTCEDAAALYQHATACRRAVIIGAGLIGLELAALMRRRGLHVTVLEAGTSAMSRVLPQEISELIVARHRSEGVRVVFEAAIQAVTSQAVNLEQGEVLAADLVIAAIGSVPDISLAQDMGLVCGNGIHVNASLQTSDTRIFSAGDCAAVDHPRLGRVRFESWRGACDQGIAAAAAMLGHPVHFTAQPWFWSDQYDLGLQMTGVHDRQRKRVLRHLPNGGVLCFELDEEGIMCAASGLAQGQAIAKEIKLAEMLIEKRAAPSAEALGDPSINLKKLLPRD